MNVLSLFDGMSCGQIALNRVGIKYDKYFASEIDKYAIKVTQHNYPDTIQLGDITGIHGYDLPDIDLLIGGSPCQGFSFAGKQLNFDDPRSKLFFEFVRLLKECKPKHFLLENVKMKLEFVNVISEHLGVDPVMINSALVSAQNRVRLYWTNIPMAWMPRDKGIVLRDILVSGVVDRDKSYCIDANYSKGGDLEQYFNRSRRQIVFTERPCKPRKPGLNSLCHHVATATDINGNESIKRVYADTGKSTALATMAGGHRQPKVLCGALSGRYIKDGKRQDQFCSAAGRTNTLTSVQKDNVVVAPLCYRKLTPVECERLQTVPDNYTACVSNTQRYKMLGNGWTVDVIAHIFKGLPYPGAAPGTDKRS